MMDGTIFHLNPFKKKEVKLFHFLRYLYFQAASINCFN